MIESILSGLSQSEKLAAVDFLWRDLSREPAQYSSPEWHKQIVTDRLANPASGESLPLDEAKSEVKERLNDRRTQS